MAGVPQMQDAICGRPPWMAGVPQMQDAICGRPPWMAGPRPRAARSFAALGNGLDLDELAVLGAVADCDGPAADGAVLDVALLLDRQIQCDLDGFPTVRAGDRLVVQQRVGP